IRDRNVTGVQTCALPILAVDTHKRERETQRTDAHSTTADQTKKQPATPSWSVILGRMGRKLGSAAFVVWAAATITFLIQTLLPEIGRASCRASVGTGGVG